MTADGGPGRPLRILLLGRGGNLDGSQRQLSYLASGLDAQRFALTLVLNEEGPLAQQLRQQGREVHILRFRKWRSFPDCLFRYGPAARLVALGRRQGVDIVHASDLWRAGYAHYAARALGAACILHVRGPITPHDMAKHRLRHASAVIAIAQRYEQDLAAAGLDGGKVQVIDDAVDLGRFRPDPSAAPALRQEIGLADCLLVGLVGRIEPFKCVREFVDIIAPLAGGADGRVAFLVVGQPGPRSYYKALLETVRQRGLSRQVIFTGRRDDMPRVMAGLDVLVTLSGGSTMFEAMACGACVLSVRADGRHSVHTRHDQTAWCVTTNQHQPATAALAQLLADGERRRRLGNAGRIQVQEHLSAGRMVVATAALYERFAVC